MAIHHAKRCELVDLDHWPEDVDPEQSHALVKTDYVEIARLVLPEGKSIKQHRIPSPIVIHCLEGTIELETERARQSIGANQLVHLGANDAHALHGLKDAVVLMTIINTG